MNINIQKINDTLTMRDIAHKYGFNVNSKGFINCPFHREKTASLKLYPNGNGWYCFGCGAGGDLIKFVMLLHNLDFNQAVQRIDYDFNLNLGIGRRLMGRERAELMRLERQRKTQIEAEKEHARKLSDNYLNALKRFTELDLQRKKYKPKQGDTELHPLFVEAIKNIEAARFLVDVAEMERRKYEQRRNNDTEVLCK